MTRSRLALVVALLGAAAFVLALVLVHTGGSQSLDGYRADPTDPDAPEVATEVTVTCAAATYGSPFEPEGGGKGFTEPDDDGDVDEDDSFTLGEQGIDRAEASDVCGRIRTERLTHAVELGFLGLLLGGGAVALSRSTPRPRAEHTPRPGRSDDGAVL